MAEVVNITTDGTTSVTNVSYTNIVASGDFLGASIIINGVKDVREAPLGLIEEPGNYDINIGGYDPTSFNVVVQYTKDKTNLNLEFI